VAEDGEIGVVHGAQDAARLLLPGEIELVVHRADGEVQFGEDRVGKVQAAVFEDVHLAALEDADAFQALVEAR